MLIDAGPSSGPHVTNAIPGLSWHNYGEAVDSYAIVRGEISWNEDDYEVYCEEAEQEGLYSYGVRHGWDYVHINLQHHVAPHKVYSLEDIDYLMRSKFQ